MVLEHSVISAFTHLRNQKSRPVELVSRQPEICAKILSQMIHSLWVRLLSKIYDYLQQSFNEQIYQVW